jgi:gliding motility-associated lipoprotein GldH
MRCFVLLALLVLLLLACDDRRVYEDSRDFDERTWNVADTPRFEFAIADTVSRYNLYCNIRNSLDYPYARLFVHYALRDSAGRELQKKLVAEFLFDQKTGRPQGRSGLGDVFDHQFMLLNNYAFRQPGKYALELEQFMRLDTLQGILSVGVRVETVTRGQ